MAQPAQSHQLTPGIRPCWHSSQTPSGFHCLSAAIGVMEAPTRLCPSPPASCLADTDSSLQAVLPGGWFFACLCCNSYSKTCSFTSSQQVLPLLLVRQRDTRTRARFISINPSSFKSELKHNLWLQSPETRTKQEFYGK